MYTRFNFEPYTSFRRRERSISVGGSNGQDGRRFRSDGNDASPCALGRSRPATVNLTTGRSRGDYGAPPIFAPTVGNSVGNNGFLIRLKGEKWQQRCRGSELPIFRGAGHICLYSPEVREYGLECTAGSPVEVRHL